MVLVSHTPDHFGVGQWRHRTISYSSIVLFWVILINEIDVIDNVGDSGHVGIQSLILIIWQGQVYVALSWVGT